MPRQNMSEEDLATMLKGGGAKEAGRKRAGVVPALTARTFCVQKFFVPGPLPGQNTYMGNGTRWTYGKDKKTWAAAIGFAIRAAKIRPMPRVHIEWVWVERNTRRDPDNFTGISKKFILDTLVSQGILKDDGWQEIAGWTDRWYVDKDEPGVWVTLQEVTE